MNLGPRELFKTKSLKKCALMFRFFERTQILRVTSRILDDGDVDGSGCRIVRYHRQQSRRTVEHRKCRECGACTSDYHRHLKMHFVPGTVGRHAFRAVPVCTPSQVLFPLQSREHQEAGGWFRGGLIGRTLLLGVYLMENFLFVRIVSRGKTIRNSGLLVGRWPIGVFNNNN